MKLTFSGTQGQRISLLTSNDSGFGCCQTLKILNPDGSQLVSDYNYANRFVDVTTLPQTGTYTITFDPDGAKTGSLTFTLYDVPPDPSATITPGGAPVTLTTTTPGQNMKLTFSGTQGQLLTLTTSNDSGFGCCQYLKIFNPDGTQLLSDFNYGNRTVTVPALPQTGTYTITYDPDGSKIGSLTFQLSVRQGGAAAPAHCRRSAQKNGPWRPGSRHPG